MKSFYWEQIKPIESRKSAICVRIPWYFRRIIKNFIFCTRKRERKRNSWQTGPIRRSFDCLRCIDLLLQAYRNFDGSKGLNQSFQVATDFRFHHIVKYLKCEYCEKKKTRQHKNTTQATSNARVFAGYCFHPSKIICSREKSEWWNQCQSTYRTILKALSWLALKKKHTHTHLHLQECGKKESKPEKKRNEKKKRIVKQNRNKLQNEADIHLEFSSENNAMNVPGQMKRPEWVRQRTKKRKKWEDRVDGGPINTTIYWWDREET